MKPKLSILGFCIRANKSLSLLRHMYLEAVTVNTMTVLQNDIS